MRQNNQFRIVLSEISGDQIEQLRIFALLNLGIVQSLASGVIGAVEAIQLFYNAENCLYVREHFRNKDANAIMSHGVQLADLFELLSAEEASREFFRELEMMRSLCMSLLAAGQSSGVAGSKVRQRKKIETENKKPSSVPMVAQHMRKVKAQ